MFQTICDLVPSDPDVSVRARRLDIMRRVLEGTLYDVLPYEFHQERSASGEYIPLRQRRPSVRYAMARVVVEDSVALLFSEGHFPRVASGDAAVEAALGAVFRECRVNQVMVDAAIRGSIGSTAILLRILKRRMFLSVLDTVWLTPVWDPEAPDTLLRVVERYKVPGGDLAAAGYEVADTAADVLVHAELGRGERDVVRAAGGGERGGAGGGYGAERSAWAGVCADRLDPEFAGWG